MSLSQLNGFQPRDHDTTEYDVEYESPVHLEGYLFTLSLFHRKKVWCEFRGRYLFVFPPDVRTGANPRVIFLSQASLVYQEEQTCFSLQTPGKRGALQEDKFHADPNIIRRWVETIECAMRSPVKPIARSRPENNQEKRDHPLLLSRGKTSVASPKQANVLERCTNYLHRKLLPRDAAKVCAPAVGGPSCLLNRLKMLRLYDSKEAREFDVSIEDFRILELLGEGTHGSVYKVQHKATAALYALKVISKEHIKRPSSFFVELYVLRTLQHPFVVRLITAFQTPTHVAVLLNYLPNGTLSQRLTRGADVSIWDARLYAAQIFLGIEYLHERGVVYRDLKPENVVLDASGACVLTDMSLARRNTLCFTICGTPLYVAPEVLLRDGYTKDVDWWSFGVILYELLVGTTPFVAETTNAIFENILTRDVRFPYGTNLPSEATSLIRALLRKNPVNRLTNPREIRMHPFFAGVDWGTMPRASL